MAQRTVETKFYKFTQNNSGGVFDIDDERGLGPRVWIEATSLEDACTRAEAAGIYFDGVEAGQDCECCGDRWSQPYGDGAVKTEIDPEYDFMWHGTVYVHLFDGTIERKTVADVQAA